MWQSLYELPAWGAFILVVGITSALAALVVGTATRLRAPVSHAEESGIAMVIHQSLIAGYAVLLAFVTVNVWQGYQDAEAAAGAEASALADLVLVSLGTHGAERDHMMHGLEGYARAMVTLEWPAMRLGERPPVDGAAILGLNSAVFALDAGTPRDAAIFQRAMQLSGQLLDARRLRLGDAAAGIGPAVWWVLILGAVVCVGSVYFFGAKR